MVYAVKRIRHRAKKFVKKRYTKKKSGTLKIGAIARDLAMVKRSLNVEHKHLDFKFGSGQGTTTQFPTKTTPIIIPLPVPARGTAYNERVGNQIRIVHMTSKIQFLFENNTDLIQRTTGIVQIIFAKSADDVPAIAKLYDTDANGHYTPMSMTNTQEYKKYVWLNKHMHKKSYIQPTNRFPASNNSANVLDPGAGGINNISVDETAVTALNKASFFSNKMGKTSIRVYFANGSDTEVEQMKPYLLLRSDVIESTTDYDPIGISGIIRMSYVDN